MVGGVRRFALVDLKFQVGVCWAPWLLRALYNVLDLLLYGEIQLFKTSGAEIRQLSSES